MRVTMEIETDVCAVRQRLASFGDLLSDMVRTDGLEISRVSKSFANDVLLALSCREEGCVLVTGNERNFQRIRRYVPFDCVKPRPVGLLP